METTERIVSVLDRHSHKMGWKACTTSTTSTSRRALYWIGLLTSFTSSVFVAGLVWRILNVDWIEPLQLRRRILEAISRSSLVDCCGFRRLLFSVDLTSDRLLNDLICRSWHNRYVEFGSFRKFTGFFASHVYICDNKGSEILTAAWRVSLLMFVTPNPAYCF